MQRVKDTTNLAGLCIDGYKTLSSSEDRRKTGLVIAEVLACDNITNMTLYDTYLIVKSNVAA